MQAQNPGKSDPGGFYIDTLIKQLSSIAKLQIMKTDIEINTSGVFHSYYHTCRPNPCIIPGQKIPSQLPASSTSFARRNASKSNLGSSGSWFTVECMSARNPRNFVIANMFHLLPPSKFSASHAHPNQTNAPADDVPPGSVFLMYSDRAFSIRVCWW